MAIERFIWTDHGGLRLNTGAARIVSVWPLRKALRRWRRTMPVAILNPMSSKFAYYDREADIAWLPTGESEDAVSEELEWGLVDHDSATDEVVAIEVWSASKRLPAEVLAALPAPASTQGAAA
jgi:uncharacterized protein YuzE